MATPNYLWKIKDKGNVVLSPDNLPTLTTGTTNGTISWNGTNIAVKGLQNSAYMSSDDFVSSKGNFLSTGFNRYATISKSNTNVFPYNKIAHIAGTGSWYDGTMLLYVTGDWNGGGFGLLRVSIRSNDQTATTSGYPYVSCEAKWLVRSGLTTDQIIIGYNNIAGAWNADLYFKTQGAYECYTFHQIETGGRGAVVSQKWTLLNTTESYGSTTSSTDNVNCYTSIENGGSYTNQVTSVDSGLVNDSNTVNGYSPKTTGAWGTIPVIKSADGVLEIGQYIDFHTTSTGTASNRDYDGRIQGQSGGGQLLIPTKNGTIAVTTDITEATSGKANGASSSTDNAIARFDGTDGKTLQNSAVTIDDDGGVVIPETANLSVGALNISHNSSNDTYVIGTPGANESLALNVNGKGQIRIKDGNIKFMSCDALNSDDYGYAYSKLPINDGSTSSNYYTIATREYVSDVISGLDGTISGTAGASKTLSALSEVDGKISATFTDIQIGESQVTNLTTDLNNKVSKSGDTLTSGATFTFADPGLGNVTTSSATNCGGFKWTGKTDGIELYAECPTTADQQYLVIKMNDDNSNKVSFRNKDGTEVAYIGANGYASFSGTIYEGGTALSSKYSPLAGSFSLTTCSKGTFGTAATYSTTTTVTSGSSALVTSDAVYQAIYGAMNTAV